MMLSDYEQNELSHPKMFRPHNPFFIRAIREIRGSNGFFWIQVPVPPRCRPEKILLNSFEGFRPPISHEWLKAHRSSRL